MSPLRVYTHTNIKRCSYMRNYIFCHLTELRQTNSCHLYVYKYTLTSNVAPNYVCIHTLTSNVALILRSYVFCHFTDLRQAPCHLYVRRSRQLMSPLRVCLLRGYILCHFTDLRQTTHVTSTCAYTHYHQRLLLYAQLYILSFNRIESDTQSRDFMPLLRVH